MAALHWILTKQRGISCRFKSRESVVKASTNRQKTVKRVGIQFNNFNSTNTPQALTLRKAPCEALQGGKKSETKQFRDNQVCVRDF